jgi:hypothetical protein
MVASLIAYGTTALTAAGMSAATAAAISTFAVNFALSTIVTRVFADNPERQQDMGVRQQVPPSAVNAVPIAYGDAYMGGTFVDAVLSTDQKTMYYVLAVSSISPNGQFLFDNTKMYYGDRLMTFDGTDQTKVISLTDEASPPNVDTKISGNLYINLYKSDAAGTITPLNGAPPPSTVMGGADIAVAQQWTGTRQMNGLAFAIVKLVYNRDADTTQLSPITFKVAHYLNGASSAKPGDVWYDYITNSVYGGAVDPAFVDSTSRTTLNTYSDALITFTNSGGSPSTQARYRINGVLDAGESVLSNIDRIMSSCDSWMTYNAALGQWSVVVNKAETASYAFTDNNIVGDIRVSATDITSSINQVEARFPFKENRDQANFINIKTPTILLYPNEPVNKYSITYDLVNDSVQAHYLANRLLEQAREDLIVSFNTTYFGIQVDAGDVVSVTNSNYGWNDKLFRVMKVNEASLADGSLGARLELSEYNVQVYDDQTINQFAPVPNSGLPNVGYFSGLTAPTVTGFSTVSVPYFNVVVAIPATGRVTFVNLYYSTTATPTASDLKLLFTASSSNSQPFTNSSSFTFGNQILPSGTYYFGYLVGNEVGQTQISPLSASFAWMPTGTVGPFVDISGVTTFSKTSSNVYTPSTATLNAVTQSITSPTYAWAITGATPTSGTAASITITPNAASTSVTAQLTVNGTNLSAPIVKTVTMGIIVQSNKYATANLYQWSSVAPGNPSGSSTYTWATGVNSTYTGGNGWSTTVPTNPGIAGLLLFVAAKQVEDNSGATSTTVSWASGYSIQTGAENGANGVQVNTAIVYRWSTGIPTISGTSTYTWATGAVTSPPTNWFTTISDTGTAGQTLWAAKVELTDSVTALTTTVNWTTASIIPFGYVGSTGAVGRIAYAASSSTLSTTPDTFTVAGDSLPATGSWQAGLVWSASVPILSAGQSVWQSEGIYNPTNNQTIWSEPYLSSLKVGNLSAVSTNTGSLTVSGNVTIGNFGNIRGGQTEFNTGTGFFLGYSSTTYKFSIGSTTKSMTWDGSVLTITGGVIQTGTTGARLEMGGPSYAQALMGYNTSGGLTIGLNANNGQVFASNYVGTIAGDFDNTSATSPALRGFNTSTGNGVAVEGRSSNYFGGAFYGGTASAPLYINPTGALPTKGAILGALCVYNNLLYFHNGTTWKQVSLI